MPRHGHVFTSPTLPDTQQGMSEFVWCCSTGELPPHVLENKALYDRFGVPSDLLLQDLTFEDEQAKKVSPKQHRGCHYMAHQPGAWKLPSPLSECVSLCMLHWVFWQRGSI